MLKTSKNKTVAVGPPPMYNSTKRSTNLHRECYGLVARCLALYPFMVEGMAKLDGPRGSELFSNQNLFVLWVYWCRRGGIGERVWGREDFARIYNNGGFKEFARIFELTGLFERWAPIACPLSVGGN